MKQNRIKNKSKLSFDSEAEKLRDLWQHCTLSSVLFNLYNYRMYQY